MSTYVYYQAMPTDSELLKLAFGKGNAASEVISDAQAALCAMLVGFHLEYPGYLDVKFPLVREFCGEYSKHPEWHFESHPIKIGGVTRLVPIFEQVSDLEASRMSLDEFTNTLGYKIVCGGEHLGNGFRLSSTEFVNECAIYCQVIDNDAISEGLKNYFDGLTNFYKTVSLDKRLLVLVMQA